MMCVIGLRYAYSFLAPNETVGAKILVVEGWLGPTELDQAVQIFKTGHYERVVTTGGPILGWPELLIHTSYAKMAADYLVRHGVPNDVIVVIPAPRSAQDRTFLSAVELRDSAQKFGINLESLDIFSSGMHSRRSRMLFQMALGPKVHVGVLSGRPGDYDPDAWWRSSSGVESMVFQTIGLIWAECCFWPGPPGTRLERWAVP
jgi:uncharacterized SAM-binding protein YcdF (DUF218 family)